MCSFAAPGPETEGMLIHWRAVGDECPTLLVDTFAAVSILGQCEPGM